MEIAIGGRFTKRTGRQAMRKRSAVSCAAEKLSSASFVATKASPQTTEVSAARTMSRTGIAPPRVMARNDVPPLFASLGQSVVGRNRRAQLISPAESCR